MGSKGPSGNTTTTQVAQNPAANAQLPALQDLYGSADYSLQNAWQGFSGQNLGNLQTYAANQAANTAPLAGGVMPAALQQYLNQINQGIPSQAQANQLTANAGQAINQGLGFSQGLAGTANNALGQVPTWQNALAGLAPGALGGMSSLAGQAATAGNPAEAGLYGNAGMALGGNPAYSSGLGGLASGAYINPSTNPAYAGMIQSATQPLINQYMTATAPQVGSEFEGAGRYGSGAATNAMGQAQYGLGQGLGNAISGITNNAYNTGLQATLGAGQALGNIYNQGVSNVTGALGTSGQLAQAGVQNAANIYNQGYGTAGNLINQGASQGLGYLNAGLTGLGGAATAAQQGYGTANTALTGAGNMLNLGSGVLSGELGQAPSFAGYPASQYSQAFNTQMLPLSDVSSILGGAIGGTGTQTASQPYYSNTGANILGGISGGLGIANTLGGASGIFPGAISAAASKF
jgi:hypothetical protein